MVVRRSATLAACMVAAVLGGCAGPVPCLLAAQHPMTLITLYFGRGIPGGGAVTDAQWSGFVASSMSTQFPDGFTVYDSNGAWRDPAGHIGREAGKVVQIAVPAATPGLAARVTAVSDAYRAQFHQEAVGVTTASVCGAF